MPAPPHFGTKFTPTIHSRPHESINPSKVTLPDGYTVLVIGAARGIGEYIARAYAQAKATNLVLTARTAADLDRVKGLLEDIAAENETSARVETMPSDASKESTFV